MTLTLTNFRSELKALGVDIFVAGEDVKIKGKLSAIPPDQKAWLKSHKDALRAMLRETDNPVYRFVSLDGNAEAFSRWKLDSRFWRRAEENES